MRLYNFIPPVLFKRFIGKERPILLLPYSVCEGILFKQREETSEPQLNITEKNVQLSPGSEHVLSVRLKVLGLDHSAIGSPKSELKMYILIHFKNCRR